MLASGSFWIPWIICKILVICASKEGFWIQASFYWGTRHPSPTHSGYYPTWPSEGGERESEHMAALLPLDSTKYWSLDHPQTPKGLVPLVHLRSCLLLRNEGNMMGDEPLLPTGTPTVRPPPFRRKRNNSYFSAVSTGELEEIQVAYLPRAPDTASTLSGRTSG